MLFVTVVTHRWSRRYMQVASSATHLLHNVPAEGSRRYACIQRILAGSRDTVGGYHTHATDIHSSATLERTRARVSDSSQLYCIVRDRSLRQISHALTTVDIATNNAQVAYQHTTPYVTIDGDPVTRTLFHTMVATSSPRFPSKGPQVCLSPFHCFMKIPRNVPRV